MRRSRRMHRAGTPSPRRIVSATAFRRQMFQLLQEAEQTRAPIVIVHTRRENGMAITRRVTVTYLPNAGT